MATLIKIRRDTAANWASNNPTLSLGEMAYETDTLKIKFGNGSSNWAALSYATLGAGGGLTLTSLAVTTGSATGGGSLAYNNATGIFTFRPANLSGYLTGITGSQVTTALGYTPLQASSLSITSATPSNQFSTLAYANGVFNFTPFQLAAATTSTLGGVKVDGTTITINNGVITAVGGGGGGGSGSVNSGLGTSLAYYPATGTTVDDASNAFWNNTTNTLTVIGTVAATTLTGAIASSQVTTALGYVPTQLASFTTATAGASAFYSALSYDQGSGLFTYTPFSLATASDTVLGGVKVGGGLSISGLGVLSLVTASDTVLGGVKVGSGLAIDGNGILSSTITQYTLPTAAAGTLGGVKVGTGLSIDGSGILSSTITQYSLPTATTLVLGGVKVDGTTITITGGGVLSAVAPSLDAANLTGSGLAINVTQSSLTSVGTLTSLTVSGLTSRGSTQRVMTTIAGATGTVTHNFAVADIFYHTGAAASWTTNVTNMPTTNDKEYRVRLIMNQGVVGYMPNAYQIDGAAQTILWQNGTPPSANANKIDIIDLTILRKSGGWIVLGEARVAYN
jgi:hypothetical protein